jgi:hypothetical protein
VDEGDKDPDEVVVVMRINVKKFQEALRHSPNVFVAHGEHTQAGENDDDPFRKLNGGDSAHAFDVSGIVDYRMHLVKIAFRYPAPDRGFILEQFS